MIVGALRRNVTIMCIALLVCTEVAALVFAPRYSVIDYTVRHMLVDNTLQRVRAFYLQQPYASLKSDERILFAHAFWHDGRRKRDAADWTDPFMRMVDQHFVGVRPRHTVSFIRNKNDLAWYLRQSGGVLARDFYHFDTRTEAQMDGAYDDILLRALYCDFDYAPIDAAILDVARDDRGGYLDTHQLIALLFRKANKCLFDGEDIDAKIDAVVDRIIAAQNRDNRFSDLSVERIVVLYWAGYGRAVRRSWMRAIVDAQDSNIGAWMHGDGTVDYHATALAAVALRFYGDGLPYRKIFLR